MYLNGLFSFVLVSLDSCCLHTFLENINQDHEGEKGGLCKPAVGLKQTPSKVAFVLHGLPAEI